MTDVRPEANGIERFLRLLEPSACTRIIIEQVGGLAGEA